MAFGTSVSFVENGFDKFLIFVVFDFAWMTAESSLAVVKSGATVLTIKTIFEGYTTIWLKGAAFQAKFTAVQYTNLPVDFHTVWEFGTTSMTGIKNVFWY